MTWNNRIVKYRDGSGYGLHEVFYDENNQPWAMTENPISFVVGIEEGPQGVTDSLFRAIRDATKHPVFEEPEEGKWLGKPPSTEGKTEGKTVTSLEELNAYLAEEAE